MKYFSKLFIALTTVFLLNGLPPAQASTVPPLTVRPENVQAITLGPGAPHPLRMMTSELAGYSTQQVTAMQAKFRTMSTSGSSLEFLTRPYTTWHDITSIFDHCTPDYSVDGKVCRFTGEVGLKSNGVDPYFSLGYAQTPGGTDYLYYDGHNGWDYALNYETVLAAADGVVQLAGSDQYNPCFGQTIIINHPNGYSTRYAHLSQIFVTAGQSIARGQVIAVSGNTGCSTGPHLHFGVYITSSWTAIDPWGWWGTAGQDPWPSDPGNLWLTGSAQFPIPWAPTNVTAIAGNGSATVSWTPPGFDGGTGLTSYTITANPGGITASAGPSATSAVVTGLNNGTSYTFTVTAINRIQGGPASTASNAVAPSAWIGQYRALTPTRILDTRNGTGGISGALQGGHSIDVPVVGVGGVPAGGVAAVALNLTATNVTAPTFVTAYPAGSPKPLASNLNPQAGQTRATLVLLGVGNGGKVTIYNNSGSADVILDVFGYFAADTTSANGQYQPLTPARIADTRSGMPAGTLHAGSSIDLQVAGIGGVPATGAAAVVLNLTATDTTAPSFFSAYPSGTTRPLVSNLNFTAGQTVANRAIVPIGSNGKVTVFNASGSADLVVDVAGWFTDGSGTAFTGGHFTGLVPFRLLDTRTTATVAPGQTLFVTVAGLDTVPVMSAVLPPRAAVLTVTETAPSAAGFLTVFPSGTSQPLSSDLNVTAGATVSNLVIAPLGSDGRIEITNASAGTTQVIVDLDGWMS